MSLITSTSYTNRSLSTSPLQEETDTIFNRIGRYVKNLLSNTNEEAAPEPKKNLGKRIKLDIQNIPVSSPIQIPVRSPKGKEVQNKETQLAQFDFELSRLLFNKTILTFDELKYASDLVQLLKAADEKMSLPTYIDKIERYTALLNARYAETENYVNTRRMENGILNEFNIKNN